MDVASSLNLHDFWFPLPEFGAFKQKILQKQMKGRWEVLQSSIKGEKFTK